MKHTNKFISSLLLFSAMGIQTFGHKINEQEPSDSNKIKIIIKEETIDIDLDKYVKDVQLISEDLEKFTEEIEMKLGDKNNRIIKFTPDENKNIHINISREETQKKRFKFNLFTLDVGINGFVDNTNYSTTDAANFVRVAEDKRTGRVFDLKTGQSRNVNIWPGFFSFDLAKAKNQKVYLSIGIPGFQFYSLKYSNPIQFQPGLDPHVIETTENYKKNKLGITYLSLPLSLTGQTKITRSKWLTYGAGVIGGYRIASWTNQKTPEDGKSKIKDRFNLNDYQVALTGEIGVKGILRLYATYNLSNMWENSLDQNLFAVGVRFFGI